MANPKSLAAARKKKEIKEDADDGRTTQSGKRKSDVISDALDSDAPAKPAKKKPGPKPKATPVSDLDFDEDESLKPVKKTWKNKTGPKPKAKAQPKAKQPKKKTKDTASDGDEVEVVVHGKTKESAGGSFPGPTTPYALYPWYPTET